MAVAEDKEQIKRLIKELDAFHLLKGVVKEVFIPTNQDKDTRWYSLTIYPNTRVMVFSDDINVTKVKELEGTKVFLEITTRIYKEQLSYVGTPLNTNEVIEKLGFSAKK